MTDNNHDLVGSKELAAMFNVSSMTISRWKRNGDLPDPIYLAAGPVWHKTALVEWAKRSGRTVDTLEDNRKATLQDEG